jgi:hypothetical protein
MAMWQREEADISLKESDVTVPRRYRLPKRFRAHARMFLTK